MGGGNGREGAWGQRDRKVTKCSPNARVRAREDVPGLGLLRHSGCQRGGARLHERRGGDGQRDDRGRGMCGAAEGKLDALKLDVHGRGAGAYDAHVVVFVARRR